MANLQAPVSKTFGSMKINVGKMVQDTSSAFATIIGEFINDKYLDAWRRCMWSACIDDNYTFESVVDQANYDLPADFDEELFVANIADGEKLQRYKIGRWWEERYSAHEADSITSGTPKRYVILREVINSSGRPVGALKMDPPPNEAETFAMPYRRKFTRLLGTTDTCTTDTANKIVASAATFITDGVQPGMRVKNTTDNTYGYVADVESETTLLMDSDLCPDGDEEINVANEIIIPDLEWIIEQGAMGEAWAYKRQFQKANYYLNKYEVELRRRMGQERSKINQLYQFMSEGYRIQGVKRLTGDLSYDSL